MLSMALAINRDADICNMTDWHIVDSAAQTPMPARNAQYDSHL
jgi:hypothetical protein